MIEGDINGKPYPIAIGNRGETLWETTDVAQERDEIWDDWSLGLGETKRESGRGYLFSQGWDASVRGALRLSPFYHNLNNTTLTTGTGYFMESVETSGSTANYDDESSGTASSATTITVEHTVASNAERLLKVNVSANLQFPEAISGITYAGQALTKLTQRTIASGQVSMWFLIDPATGTNDIVVTLVDTDGNNIVVGATSWYGINADTPFGTAVSAIGTSTSPSVTVSTEAGEFVDDVVFVNAVRTFTAGANQTKRWDDSATNISGAGSTQAGSDGGVMSHTLSGTGSPAWAIIAVPIKPSSTTSRSVMHILDATKIGRYVYDSDTGITLSATDTTASGVGGRPAKMNGNWYAPMGSAASAQKLSGTTWSDVSGTWKADHLSTYQKGITPTLARVNSTTQNQVDFNEDTGAVGDNWSGGQKVGDSSTKITDLVETLGNLYPCKEDNLYEFGIEAESRPVIPFIGRGKIDADNGKGSFAFGDEIVYMTKGDLWRYRIGRGALPIGMNTIRSFRKIAAIPTPKSGRPAFGVQVGEYWYYLQNEAGVSNLIQARKRREGDPEGHELIQHSVLRLPLCLGMGVDSRNRLWLKGAFILNLMRDIFVVQLAEDGSLDIENRKGQASAAADISFDERNPGRPQDKVQIRRMTVETEGDWDATTSLQLKLWLDDGSSPVSVGDPITSSGMTTRNPTVGTDDTAYRIRPQLTLTTNSSYTPKNSDPQVLRVIVGIRFPEIIRIVIPADDGVVRGVTAIDVAKNLRRLQNQGTVTFRAPDSIATFSAEVFSVTDTMYATKDGFAHGIQLQIRRWMTA